MNNIGFKKVGSNSKMEYSPELLFRDLRGRSPDIKGIWSHQADILRQYQEKYLESSDVSLELPTGAGKTLVGLLLGLYRRKKFGEKILYLCPTRQLANQVLSHSKDYNIKCHIFIGKQKEYPQKEFSEYQTGEAIAISTYSGLFNIKPRFNNPDIIIFDDAHASESYISSFWSLGINRFDHKEIFFKIISLFEDIIPKYLMRTIEKDTPGLRDRKFVDMIPGPYYWERIDSIRDIFEENVEEGKNLFFQWQNMKRNLESCILYISWYEILIRPWIPPTLTHIPFSKAKQRIYMSATLGSGGELERIIGIPKINRIPIPPGWETQGSGRRFFIFPDYSFKTKEYFPWLVNLINKFKRTLVLCPDFQTLNEFKNISGKLGMTHSVLTARDIEDSLDCFSENTNTVLMCANRYDGLDLPGDTCRHLILNDIPIAVNIQEKFLHDRLAILSLLKDRIVTRITQAAGRTTRGDTDFSLVTIIGRRLFDFCANKSNRFEMHPELQAEIEFGINQSDVTYLDELSQLIDLFLKQDEEWKEADNDIKQLRNGFEKKLDDQTKILYSIVKEEVNYQYQLWKNDYELALESARKIIDNLPRDKFEGYRGLWCYYAGNIARKLSEIKSNQELETASKTYYQEATTCSRTISWFSEFLNTFETKDIAEEIDLFSSYAVEKIQENLSNWGSIGTAFEKKIDENKKLVNNNRATQFEMGLTELGNMLGFEAYRPIEESNPDSIWRLGDRFAIIFEAKSGKDMDGVISVDNCRQSTGHYNWANNDTSCKDVEKKIVVIITPCQFLKNDAVPHADELYYMDINRIRQIFDIISGIYRRIRAQLINYDSETVRQIIFTELKSKNIDPESLLREFESNQLKDLPVLP
jgi:hypothetical protein